MKIISNIILLGLLLTLGISSCSDKVDEPLVGVSIEFENKEFPYLENQSFIRINSAGAWTASSNQDWCSVSPSSGEGSGVIVIHLDENEGNGAREAEISIVCGKEKSVYVIKQSPQFAIEFGVKKLQFSADANLTQKVEMTTTSDWELVAKPDWLTVNPNEGKAGVVELSISVDAYTGDILRSGNLVFKIANDTLKEELPVEQLSVYGSLTRRDSVALHDFFSKLQMDDIYVNEVWDPKKPMSTWRGVKLATVNGAQRVVSLEFNYVFGATGSMVWPLNEKLPETFKYLTELQILNLAQCRLGGNVPECIKELKKLISLDLCDNLFEGEVPAFIGELTNLEYLNLSVNNFTSISPAIGNLVKLTELNLSHNSFDVIPDMFVKMTNLAKLSIFRLYKIREGVIVNPDIIDQILNKKNNEEENGGEVIIEKTAKKSFPKTILSLKNLKELYVHDANFTGELPSGIGNMAQLELFTAYDNDFSGSIPNFSGCTLLTSINLANNNFTGGIPSTFSSNYYLRNLILSGNPNLGGKFPAELGKMNFLMVLELANCGLVGEIPVDAINSSGLMLLDLNDNQLTGTLPESIKSCVSLEVLFINNNKFTGLSEGLRLCTRLSIVEAANNQLAKFPTEICNLPLLNVVSLRNNEMVGELPYAIVQAKELQGLDVSNNRLTSIAEGICANHPFAAYWQWKELICPQKTGILDMPEGAVDFPLTPGGGGGSLFPPGDDFFPMPEL